MVFKSSSIKKCEPYKFIKYLLWHSFTKSHWYWAKGGKFVNSKTKIVSIIKKPNWVALSTISQARLLFKSRTQKVIFPKKLAIDKKVLFYETFENFTTDKNFIRTLNEFPQKHFLGETPQEAYLTELSEIRFEAVLAGDWIKATYCDILAHEEVFGEINDTFYIHQFIKEGMTEQHFVESLNVSVEPTIDPCYLEMW